MELVTLSIEAMSAELFSLREGAWPLDDLVEHANRLLPSVLPKEAAGRAADAVNQRLVRHYTTQGLLDEPLKEGREARYLYRHLLQLMALRRLLAEGFSSAVVGRVLAGRSEGELEELLSGRLRVELVPEQGAASDRAEFLRRVRERAGLESSTASALVVGLPSAPPAAPSGPAPRRLERTPAAPAPYAGPFHESAWTRLEVLDGLELMVRSDFKLPDTRLGDAELVQLLKVTLLHLEQKQRGKP